MPRRSSSVRSNGPTEMNKEAALRIPRKRYHTTDVQVWIPMPPSIDSAGLLKLAKVELETDDIEVEQLRGQLLTTYALHGPANTFCLLRCSSHPNVRLLRCENHRLATEAAAVRLLAQRQSSTTPLLLAETSGSRDKSYTLTGPYTGPIGCTMSTANQRQTLKVSTTRYLRGLATIPGGAPQMFGLSTHPQASWPLGFGTLLNSLLLDAEDTLLSIPYAAIRAQVRRHSASLAQVKSARLVMLDAPGEEDVVVDPATGQVTALLDYGSALWADALFSSHLYQHLSVDGLEDGGDDPHTRARRLLYVCFYSLLAILRQCLRPSIGSEGKELEARRALTAALGLLASFG